MPSKGARSFSDRSIATGQVSVSADDEFEYLRWNPVRHALKPYHLLVTGATILLAIAAFVPETVTVDLYLHDTFYVVSARYHPAIGATLLLALSILSFAKSDCRKSNFATWIYSAVPTLSVMAIAAIPFIEIEENPLLRHKRQWLSVDRTQLVSLAAALLLITQVVFWGRFVLKIKETDA